MALHCVSIRRQSIIMAGLAALSQDGLVSIWGEGGTGRIYSARRERVDALSRFKYICRGWSGTASAR